MSLQTQEISQIKVDMSLDTSKGYYLATLPFTTNQLVQVFGQPIKTGTEEDDHVFEWKILSNKKVFSIYDWENAGTFEDSKWYISGKKNSEHNITEFIENTLKKVKSESGVNKQKKVKSESEVNKPKKVKSESGVNKPKKLKSESEVNKPKKVDSESGVKKVKSESGVNKPKKVDSESGVKKVDSESGVKKVDSESGVNKPKKVDSESDSESGFESY